MKRPLCLSWKKNLEGNSSSGSEVYVFSCTQVYLSGQINDNLSPVWGDEPWLNLNLLPGKQSESTQIKTHPKQASPPSAG